MAAAMTYIVLAASTLFRSLRSQGPARYEYGLTGPEK